MKVFVTVAVFAFVAGAFALTDEQKAKGDKVAGECGAELKVSLEEIKKLKGGDFSNKDESIQCFAKCFLEKVDFLKDGQLQEAYVIERLSQNDDKDKVAKAVEACRSVEGEGCAKAYNLYKCYFENKAALA